MKPRALIIEDDHGIIEALVDRLDSLGHDSDRAADQNEARERLNRCSYDYVILDLELPVRFGRPSSITTGRNILIEIRKHPKQIGVPVLVVTAHGHDGPDLAVEMMKLGAHDFIKKPFVNLEAAIAEALSKKQLPPGQAPESAPMQKFTGGKIVFQRDSIELDGTPIASLASGTIWRILLLLRERRNDGRPRAFPAKMIAERLGLNRGQNAVTEAISAFRKKVIEILAENGLGGDENAVVVSGKSGYELANHLTIVDESGKPSPTGPESEAANATVRRNWILEQLRLKRKLTRRDIEQEFKISPATAKRDLAQIGDLIDFTGSGANGHYRLK